MMIVMLVFVMVFIVEDIIGMLSEMLCVRWVCVLVVVGRMLFLVGCSSMLLKVRLRGMFMSVILCL